MFPSPQGTLNIPHDTEFWTEARSLAADENWQRHCARTTYLPPTDHQVLADLGTALKLGLRPRFFGTPAWARHLLHQTQTQATEHSDPDHADRLATVHHLRTPTVAAT